jgi:hypothetical protein
MALAQILNHAALAVSRLAAQFVEAPLMKGLVTAIANEVQTVEDGLYAILLTRDVENATDATLDGIGALVGAPLRGAKTLDQYRNRIKAQILANRSYGNATVIYQIAPRIILEWADPNVARIREDRLAGYTVEPNEERVNSAADAKDLGYLLDEVSPAGVRGIVLSQSSPDAETFCFENGPGLGFGDGNFAAAYDGGQS